MPLRRRPDPIAIVGLSLRGPGEIDDAASYWSAVIAGRDLISALPEERRRAFPGEWDDLVTRGGYVRNPFDFDARFFGMSPREARAVDPQHRLLLEVIWEAFEDAAIPPQTVAGDTGLLVGVTGQDYWHWLPREPNAYFTTGNGHSFAAGRVAHQLGLQGPAFALDTACSSGLVAVHTACRFLAAGDCDVAVAASVNLALSPRTTRAVAKTGALSPDGVPRPFDAAANGFVRGEACAAVILKRLPDAIAAHDRIHAVIMGSAINQDGRSSSFTAPNEDSQERVIRSLLDASGISGDEIGYHEAHGTGTPVGDPVEIRALARGMRRTPDSPPLFIGSVKANVGHTEAAAGLLGMIKAVLCLQRRTIPPQPRITSLNPQINLSGTNIVIPVEAHPWEKGIGSHASVCSYGMSGTNAFAILSAPPAQPRPRASEPVPGYMVSARTKEGVRALAGRYLELLSNMPEEDYRAFAYTVTHGRQRLQHTAWVSAASAAAAREAAPACFLDSSQPLPWSAAPATRAVTSAPTYPWEHVTYVVPAREES